MSQKMFYIQNYDYCPKNNLYRADTTGRFLEGQYMGSSEFEFGSVQESWQYLRENDIKLFEHEAQSKGGLAKKVTFFVITTDEGHASGIAYVLDKLERDEIVGTLAGQNTILIIARDATQAASLLDEFEDLLT